MWNHRYDLIKFVPNIFKICHLVALTSENTDLDLIFSTLSLVFLNFINFYLVCDGILSIDNYDPHIFLIMPYKLMTGWSYRFLWETNFNMWNHRYDLIKFGPNLFKICHLVALTSENTYLDLIFSTLSLVFLNFIKFYSVCDGIFLIDSYYPHIFLILRCKLMTCWWIWYFINDISYCKIFIIQWIKTNFISKRR